MSTILSKKPGILAFGEIKAAPKCLTHTCDVRAATLGINLVDLKVKYLYTDYEKNVLIYFKI